MPRPRPHVLCAALALLTAGLVANALATDRPVPLRAGEAAVRHGGPAILTKTEVDTTDLLGGPDRVDGRFEDADGQPHWHGWTHRDESVDTSDYWEVSDHQPLAGPYSMWCGTLYDDGPGYGNSWRQNLVFRHPVDDPQATVTVDWSGLLRTDTEPAYDFVRLQVNRGGEWETLQSYDGAQTLPFAITVSLAAGDYAGDAADEVQLRVRFESDGAWSDEDGLFQSEGACWVDELQVAVGGEVIDLETFDDGDPGAWRSAAPPGVGDFAQLWLGLQDLDPCASNLSTQVAFIDDGVVVPGTGGTQCITWCYGPGGYIVNNTGGLMGPDWYLRNTVESPVLEWPEGNDAIRVAFDVYRHEELGALNDWPGIFYTWAVRSTNDPVNDPIGGKNYAGRSFIYYGGPAYLRAGGVVTDLMVPGRVQVQLKLACNEYGYLWGWTGEDGTPAPYFDNVAVTVWPYGGPALASRSVDLANDAFPASGTLDFQDLGANSVRFDMAMNIAPEEHLRNDPGDSITANVGVVSDGAELLRLPRMYVRMKANPVFDAHRVLPPTFNQTGDIVSGYVEGDSIWSGSHWIDDRYAFDLPDTGFFYPGDVIHYYLEAGDVLAGDQRWATLPADTTDFTAFGPLSKYDPDFVVRALPTVFSPIPGDQPEILVWNDAHPGRGYELWRFALRNLGLQEGREYDLYETRGASSGVGNGLGGRATSAQLAGYVTLLYTCGDLTRYVLGDGDFETDPSNDLAVLSDWFAQENKNALFTGDAFLGSTATSGPAGAAFVNTYLPVTLYDVPVRPLIGNQVSPTVRRIAGNGVLVRVTDWVAHGGCPIINDFDAVEAAGTSVRLAEFLDPAGDDGVYPYAAALYNAHAPDESEVVVLPYDLATILSVQGWTPPAGYQGIPARAVILEDILDVFGMYTWPPPIAADPPDGGVAVRCFPNPFNPSTTIALDLPRDADVRVKLYDVRGGLVRVLADERLVAGRHELVWDGRDDRGAPVASGVYFAETRALQETRLTKLTLVK